MSGGIFKRCGCRSSETGRLLSSACPQLPERRHGSWYFDCAVPVLPGRRERLRRGGYPTRREAIAARDALLGNGDTATAEGWTVERWLRYWLTTRTRIRPTRLRSYETHVENHLIPHLGRLRLSELAGWHITDMITAIGGATNRYGRPPTPSTLHRIRATLRSALNGAIREGLLRDNPARNIAVSSPRRPHAQVWTAQRVKAWEQTGERPSVAVWTTEQTATFLSFVAKDRLAVMWWLIALRGLRRGEAAGLRWADVDLDAGVAMIEQQRIANGHLVTVGPPKTAASRRLVALDRHTVRLLREHRRSSARKRTATPEHGPMYEMLERRKSIFPLGALSQSAGTNKPLQCRGPNHLEGMLANCWWRSHSAGRRRSTCHLAPAFIHASRKRIIAGRVASS
jgi:integrase